MNIPMNPALDGHTLTCALNQDLDNFCDCDKIEAAQVGISRSLYLERNRGVLNPGSQLMHDRNKAGLLGCCGLTKEEGHALNCVNHPRFQKPDAVLKDGTILDFKTKDSTDMKRFFGHMPGGGLINVLVFDADAFGVVGERATHRIIAASTKERRSAFGEVGKMLKAFKLMGKNEQILNISLGCNKLGHSTLAVVTTEGVSSEVSLPPNKEAS